MRYVYYITDLSNQSKKKGEKYWGGKWLLYNKKDDCKNEDILINKHKCQLKNVSRNEWVTSETGRPNVFPKNVAFTVSIAPRRGAPGTKQQSQDKWMQFNQFKRLHHLGKWIWCKKTIPTAK